MPLSWGGCRFFSVLATGFKKAGSLEQYGVAPQGGLEREPGDVMKSALGKGGAGAPIPEG